jgi:cell division protein FtsQ
MTTVVDSAPPADTEAPPRRSRRRLYWGAALAAAAAVLIGWLVAFSSVFGVRSVDVVGTKTLTPDAIRAAADIEHGTPLVRLDTAAVSRRVQALPEVASVRVEESFPSTVTITVVERTAVGFVQSGSTYRLVDRTGKAYRAATVAPHKLPELVVPDSDSGSALSAIAVVAADLPAGVRNRVTSVQAMDPDAITLVLRSEKVVRWGSVDDSALKARILPVLLHQPGQQFDLSDPTQPVVR